jgi:hypothetical protein
MGRSFFCLTKHYSIKAYAGMDIRIHVFLTSSLDESECSSSRLGLFYLRGMNRAFPLDNRLGGPLSRLGQYEEVLEHWPFGRTARSQSLYRLSYRKTYSYITCISIWSPHYPITSSVTGLVAFVDKRIKTLLCLLRHTSGDIGSLNWVANTTIDCPDSMLRILVSH